MPWPMRFGPPPRMITFLLVGRPRLALVLVRRVHVRRVRLELGAARVDALVDRAHARGVARRAHLGLGRAGQRGDPAIAHAEPLVAAQVEPIASSVASPTTLDLGERDLADVMRGTTDRSASARARARASARAGTPRPTWNSRSGDATAIARSMRGEVVAERRHRQVEARRGRSRASGSPCRAPRGTCGRSPSPRRPTSSAGRAPASPTGTSRTRTAATSRPRSRSSARTTPA